MKVHITKIALAAVLLMLTISNNTMAQEKGLINNSKSPYAKLNSVNIGDVTWTQGFWANRFEVCKNAMVPLMMGNYMDDSISHAFKNFEIAAGLDKGSHIGPPFHDGDFYKMLEGQIMVFAKSGDPKLGAEIDRVIAVIGKSQREDGYIHTPVMISEKMQEEKASNFAERMDFETYNIGHLQTAACLHYRITGKQNLFDIAIKATDFLYAYYKDHAYELAQNAICPSHYMGVVEMYRSTGDKRYLELAKGLVDIRKQVEHGTDHNQDRIPFRQQDEAVGHAVRANYLYAGVADVYAETGDASLMTALNRIWEDMVNRKMYITGACGALYDGVSPNGTTYDQPAIQQVHQAYGSDYELPNITAHNESCANIGNLLWNWRMLQVTGDAAYADVMETVMYNSLLAGVSLDGKGYFYTNPLAVATEISDDLRWSKQREPYISYCNCCPPNTIRTISQIQEYFYSKAKDGLYIHFYGGNELNTTLNNTQVSINQETAYPWNGSIKITLNKFPKDGNLYLRIPGWAKQTEIKINNNPLAVSSDRGTYVKLTQKWKKGDVIELKLGMKPALIASNPLVEANKNQVAVRRGPVVYCLESPDIAKNSRIFDYKIPSDIVLNTSKTNIADTEIMILEGELIKEPAADWSSSLYQEIESDKGQLTKVKLIPYFAWDNRGKSEMTVWIPLR